MNLKKSIFAVAALSAVMAVSASANPYEEISVDKNTINIVVDGERVVADNFLYNDTTYVPLRRIAEMLGKNVEYVEEGNKALITDTDQVNEAKNDVSELEETVNTQINVERNTMNIYVNGEKVEADNFLYNDTTYVPLRIVSEMFKKNVDWEQLTNTATIGKKASSVFDGNVLGTINEKEYTDTIYEGYKTLYSYGNYTTDVSEIDKVAFEQIKYDFAIMDAALERGITAGVGFENDYAKEVAAYEAQNGGKEGFEHLLSQNGYTYDMYHYTQMINNLYNSLVKLDEFVPNEEEIEKYYEDNKATVFAFDGVRAKHILIMPESDENGNSTEKQWKKALETANKVYKLAKNGEEFDSLIEEYNMDPGMQTQPEGYTFTKGEMVSEFEDACYAMEPGEISEPVQTDYGYHIIELEEKIPYYEFDDSVKAFIKSNLSQENLSKYLINISDNYVVTNK